MEQRWTAVKAVTTIPEGVDRVPIGPAGDTLPRAFVTQLDHNEAPLRLTLSCELRDDRVRAVEVTVHGVNGTAISPRDLGYVDLGGAIYTATEALISPGHGAHVDRRPGRRLTKDELVLVAAVYAFQFAAGGNPRQAIMTIWDVARATANRWARQAREAFPDSLPELD